MADISKYFINKNLLDHALTHRSWVNENPGKRTSNERLEFLGDAILEFVVSKHIFSKFIDKEEGFLTALRANLVNTVNLAKIALGMGLGEKLYLSKGEEDGGGRLNTSLLADTVEAIIGAIYVDSGIENAEKFINAHILEEVEEMSQLPLKDAKSRLQELVQANGKPAPRYVVLSESGPDHNKEFIMNVIVDNDVLASGNGKNKSVAAQNAAENALVKLGAE